MKTGVLMASILAMSVAGFATTYSNANLNGSYTVVTTQPAYDVWTKTFTCPTNQNVTFTLTGAATANQITFGVATFDGNGNISITFTNTSQFNQAASAATMSVMWNSSCQVTRTNSGHIVYLADTQQTQTGTYSVQSDGTGTITIVGSVGENLQLAATDSTGISSTIVLHSPTVNGKISNAGTGARQ